MSGTLTDNALHFPDVRYFSDGAVLTGGPDCPDNEPIQDLADRTAYLKALVDALSGSSGTFQTEAEVDAAIAAAISALINTAPATLDTLNELASALGNDPNFAATLTASLALKANIASPTLTGVPAAPTAAPGSNTTQIATTAFVAAALAALSGSGLGYSQVWTNVSGSRVAGTTYQNTTGKPIVVDVESSATYGSTTNVQLSVFVSDDGGSTWDEFATNIVVGTSAVWSRSVIVPNGHHYKFTHSGTAHKVRELR